jgi:hypothetical protein
MLTAQLLAARIRAVNFSDRPPPRTMGIWDARAGIQDIRPSEFDVGDEVIARAVA